MRWTGWIIGAGITLGTFVLGRKLFVLASKRRRESLEPTYQWGVPFASPTGVAWPVVTSSQNKLVVAHRTESGEVVGDLREGVSASRYFGARRESGIRQHAGIDLVSQPGDPILAMEDGKVIGSIGGYVGLDAVVIEHASLVAIYAEIAPGALKSTGLSPGDMISAGTRIGTAQSSPQGSMLHVELWEKGFAPKSFTPWMTGKLPAGLLDPSIYLLTLAAGS